MITEFSSWFWWGSVFCGSPSFRRRRVGASISPYKHWLATWLPLSAEFFFLPYLYQESTNKYVVFVRCATNNHFVTTRIYKVWLLMVISPWSIFFDVQGAFWGMVIGHSVGISRMVLDFIYPSPKCGEQDTRPGVVANIHFTYFSVLVLGLSWVVCLFVSLFTKAPSKDGVRLGVHDGVHCSIV